MKMELVLASLSYEELQNLYKSAKPADRSHIKAAAKVHYSSRFCESDFPIQQRGSSYIEYVKKYLVSENADRRAGLKSDARYYWPSLFKLEDFPARRLERVIYDQLKQLFQNEDDGTKRSSFRKRAEREFPNEFCINDFPLRKRLSYSSYEEYVQVHNTLVTNKTLQYNLKYKAKKKFPDKFNKADFIGEAYIPIKLLSELTGLWGAQIGKMLN